MAETRRLAVDLEDLCLALEDASPEHAQYLDLETGELLLVSDYMDDAEKEALEERLEHWFRFKDGPRRPNQRLLPAVRCCLSFLHMQPAPLAHSAQQNACPSSPRMPSPSLAVHWLRGSWHPVHSCSVTFSRLEPTASCAFTRILPASLVMTETVVKGHEAAHKRSGRT
jgi:hypothetical protein